MFMALYQSSESRLILRLGEHYLVEKSVTDMDGKREIALTINITALDFFNLLR